METTTSDSLKAKKVILKGKRAVATYLRVDRTAYSRAIARGDALKVVDEVLEFCSQPRTDEGQMGLDLSKSTLY